MLKKLLIFLINVYQAILRGILPVSCRFEPSCSEYTKQAILKYGPFKGPLLGLRRVFLCHPFSGKSGYYPLE